MLLYFCLITDHTFGAEVFGLITLAGHSNMVTPQRSTELPPTMLKATVELVLLDN